MPDSLREYLCAVPRVLNAKNPRRNAAVYHAKRLGFSRDWIVKMMFYYAASMSHYLQSFRTVVARASDSYTSAIEM